MPSSRRSGDKAEILHTLGRAALAYGISRLARQESSGKQSSHSSDHSSSRKDRSSRDEPSRRNPRSSKDKDKGKDKESPSSSGGSDASVRSTKSKSSHRSSSDKDKSKSKSKPSSSSSRRHHHSSGSGTKPHEDQSDLHHHMTQLAAGALAFGVKQYMHHRKEKKRSEGTSHRPSRDPNLRDSDGYQADRGLHNPFHRRPKPPPPSQPSGQPPYPHTGVRPDGELSSALSSLTAELQETSESIRRLARNKPSHRNCEVHRGLVENEARIRAGLSGLQTSVNNMRNLYPGLDGGGGGRGVGGVGGGLAERERHKESGVDGGREGYRERRRDRERIRERERERDRDRGSPGRERRRERRS